MTDPKAPGDTLEQQAHAASHGVAINAAAFATVIIHQHHAERIAEPPAKAKTGAAVCPYPGLRSFRREDARFFAGRDGEVAKLAAALERQLITGVIAASGTGKSSLIHAGVLPALEAQGVERRWDVFAFKPGREPLKSLARALASILGPYEDFDAEAAQINRRVRNLRSGETPLRDLVDGVRRQAREQGAPSDHRVLFFVDQWEELYTQLDDARDRAILLRELMDVAERGEAQVLLTMRADFLPEMMKQDTAFFAALEPNIHYLKPMSEANIRAAIENPAKAVGLEIPEGLASMILADVTTTEPGADPAAAGYLPYLQFTLKRLWELRDADKNALTVASYETLGGVRGAIGAHAQEAFEALTEAERALAKSVLPRLVHVSGPAADISIRQPFSAFSPAAQGLLRRLAEEQRRLVVLHGDAAQPEAVSVEVAHEALLRDWPLLKGWIKARRDFFARRDRLEADAGRWREENQDPDYLIPPGKPLRDARDLLSDAEGDDFSSGLTAYIRASIEAEAAKEGEERARTVRDLSRARQRFWAASAAALILAAVGVGWYLAAKQATANESAALAALAQSAANNGRPADAATFALASWPRDKNDSRPSFDAAWEVIRRIAPYLQEIETLEGHEGGVNGAQYSPDETRILSWGVDGALRLWDAQTGALIKTLEGHEGGVWGAQYSPDETRILSWGDDGDLRLWDAQTGALITTLEGHEGVVPDALYSPDETRILSWGDDGDLRLWDAQTGALIKTLESHEGRVNGALYSPDETRILSWGLDGDLRLWDAQTGAFLKTFEGSYGFGVNGAQYSPDEMRILSWGSDGDLRLWDAQTGALIKTLEGHKNLVVSGAQYSPDETRILSWGVGGALRLWDAQTGMLIKTLEGHESWINGAQYSPDETRILSWAGDSTLRLWDAQTGALIKTLEGDGFGILKAQYSSDETHILSWGDDSALRLWDAQTGALIKTLEGHESRVLGAQYSSNETRILSWGVDGALRLWDAQTGALIKTLEGHKEAILGMQYSPDETRILSWGDDGDLRLWDAQTGALIKTLEGHESRVNGALYSPDETRILSWGEDDDLRLWNAQTGTLIKTLEGHESGVNGAQYSPDETRILSWGYDGDLRLWNAQTGALIIVFKGHSFGVDGVRYSPDETRILSWGVMGRALMLWDAQTGVPITALEGHEGAVTGAQYSSDARRILSWGGDGFLMLWDAQTDMLITTLEGHEGWVSGALYSPDETRILSWGGDGSLMLWDAQTGMLITTLEGHEFGVRGAQYSPDETRILSWGDDGYLRLWDVQTGASIIVFEGHEGGVNGAQYSPDETRILSWGYDGDLRLWDVQTGASIIVFEGHSFGVDGARYSPNKTRILSWGWDGVLRLWNVERIPSGTIFEIICHRLGADQGPITPTIAFGIEAEPICEAPDQIPLPEGMDGR